MKSVRFSPIEQYFIAPHRGVRSKIKQKLKHQTVLRRLKWMLFLFLFFHQIVDFGNDKRFSVAFEEAAENFVKLQS